MPFLVIDRERYALPIGEIPLGGDDGDAVPPLAGAPLAAVIEVLPDGTATLHPVAGDAVRVNDAPAGTGPVALRHGMRLVVGAVSVLYGDMAAHGSTTHVAGVTDDDLALLAGLAPVEPTGTTGGRLVSLLDGAAYDVAPEGVEIGRDPACGVPLVSRDASRIHARIAPGLLGYVLTDASANGVFVNGARVDGTRVLGNGDRVRFGREEFEFRADAATFAEPPASAPVARDARGGATSTAPAGPPPTLFATFEVLNTGVLQGTRFRIERPVAQVGRGAHNDVRLADDSVSGAHATLTRRANGWVVLDLGSTNGTYVDGERITGERRLDGSCELRFGNVKVLFRAMRGADRDEASTRALVGVPERGNGG